jgi:hypothetical protein
MARRNIQGTQELGTMKKTMFAIALGVALLSPAITSAAKPGQGQGCSIFKGCDKKATPMPEPGSIMMLASGLLSVGGFAALRRKK